MYILYTATCYMNCLLQTLFMTPEFRASIYKMKLKGTHIRTYTHSHTHTHTEDSGLLCEVQKLFAELQLVKHMGPLSPMHLTNAFGWVNSEAMVQQDIMELCSLLFEAIEDEKCMYDVRAPRVYVCIFK